MPYTRTDWLKRCRYRTDLTAHVTHLTRRVTDEGNPQDAVDVIVDILRDRQINGSTTSSGFIVGGTPAACFFDAPLYSLFQTILHDGLPDENKNESHRIKYELAGLMFQKPYVYKRGGRPVIYDRTEDAKQYLPSNQWWRIVNFNLNNEDFFVDWTHEREWRVPNQFAFEIEEAVVVLHHTDAIRRFHATSAKGGEDVAKLVKAIVPLSFVYY